MRRHLTVDQDSQDQDHQDQDSQDQDRQDQVSQDQDSEARTISQDQDGQDQDGTSLPELERDISACCVHVRVDACSKDPDRFANKRKRRGDRNRRRKSFQVVTGGSRSWKK